MPNCISVFKNAAGIEISIRRFCFFQWIPPHLQEEATGKLSVKIHLYHVGAYNIPNVLHKNASNVNSVQFLIDRKVA